MDLTSLLQMTGIAGGLGLFFWKIIDKRFDKIDKKFEQVDEKFDKMWNKIDERFAMAREEILDNFRFVNIDMQEVKQRLSALEAETILYNMIPDENRRSESAKKMWEKRRQKRLLKHSSPK